jgi:two-component system, NarL family, sensor kinase
MRLLRSPVTQFLVAGLLTTVAILLVTRSMSQQAAKNEAISDARTVTQILAHSVAEPELTDGLVRGEAGSIDRFDLKVLDRLLVRDVRRVKIWDADGTIIYSDDTEQIGQVFDLDADQERILREGGVQADVSDLSRPENALDEGESGQVEVYTRIVTPKGEPLLFEAYFAAAEIERRTTQILVPFGRITTFGLLLLLGVATPMLWVLTQRLTRAGNERERLLLSAVRASEAERRRIARDLHDGVVQDLAGTAFAISAIARAETTTNVSRTALNNAAQSLRNGLRTLRSLLVEIHPPGLSAESLPSALEDLIAPAGQHKITATVRVGDTDGISDAVVALIWRVAQEGVRNALRHAQASRLDVSVDQADGIATLVIADDGIGISQAPTDDRIRYGLQGLRTLVSDSGGELVVDSGPNEGTTVTLRIRAA